MAEQEYTPTEADRLARIIRRATGGSHAGSASLAEAIADSGFLHEIRTDERAKRPDREQVIEKLAEALGEKEALFCTRDWSGWTYNTMTAEDFMDVSGDAEALGEVADAVLSSLALEPEAREEPTVEEWTKLLYAERERQIAKGYTPEHDAAHGLRHLLNWALEYARRGRAVEASALVLSALQLPASAVRQEPTKQLATYVHDIKLARHIVIDDNVTIDGFVLPWWVTQDMAIEDLTGDPEGSPNALQTVRLAFFADRVTVDEEKVAELGTTIARIPFDREPREESEDDEPDTPLDDCPACDTALSDCSPDEACCEDCSHTANWPASEVPELEREKARAWDTLAQHPIFAGSEGLARVQALAMWRKLDSLIDIPAAEAREVTEAKVEAHEHDWQGWHDGYEVCTDCPEAAESDGNHYRRAAREVSRG
ncbi:hypothetical protein [Pseudoclavibacter terrae]|uniref:Uncharacterized protein n=1 Tax=Pseudoclavibacter terrae TaxID=1530195 RepID=A0A7J5B6U9_9MICO|nr:hypothetical protein [Pseudoclavibacter terrae]KAB1639854.1 hypothetical protein F8O03_05970 [Pseudoclavibacter terrae]